jgi:hypothetical protein
MGYLNRYHDTVREILSPHLGKRERQWLAQKTRRIAT